MASPLHSSLRPVANLQLIAVWATIVLLFCLFIPHPNKLLVLATGAVPGAVAGWFQFQAMQSETPRFLAARSAFDVRAALLVSPAGRRALRTLWLTCILLLGEAMFLREGFVFGTLAGVAAFFAVRELGTLRACSRLAKAAKAAR